MTIDPVPTEKTTSNRTPRRLPVLGVPIDVIDAGTAARRLIEWAEQRCSRVVCLCNVHSLVSAGSNPGLLHALSGADLAAPDGAPVAWMLRRLGAHQQRRVAGPDLMADALGLAEEHQVSVYLYGGSPSTLALLTAALQRRWPGLKIAGSRSPPFRAATAAETADDLAAINRSGAGIVWVGLGCPKQELWMAERRTQVRAVMVGVGAAFDFLAGARPRAPGWMRRFGLEWLHRLLHEPRRLGGRYLRTNTRFIVGAVRQLLRGN